MALLTTTKFIGASLTDLFTLLVNNTTKSSKKLTAFPDFQYLFKFLLCFLQLLPFGF